MTVQAYVKDVGWQTIRRYDLEQTTRTFNYEGYPTQSRLLLTGLVQLGKG